jgi:LysR family hydrogen peroxide-inducible transcriptional activator
MTLTELKYIVALARERHFGRAADACFVSQPTLSVAIKKLEEELNVTLFERGSNEVSLTPIGDRIVEQAQRVLEDAAKIKELAQQGKNPLSGPLRLGVIYTIGPYLLPALVGQMIQRYPEMPLLLQENFTVKLLELLKQGEIDVAVLALPIVESGVSILPLYDESFCVAMPARHEWANRESIPSSELKGETMLLLGAGHCFRDQVLEVCPELARFSQNSEGIQRTFEGSSLETIRHMVASGIGITLLPSTSIPKVVASDSLLRYVPLQEPAEKRRVALVWRKSFSRCMPAP